MHIFDVSLLVLVTGCLFVEKTNQFNQNSNNNLSSVIQLISCAPATSIIGSFIWTKLRPAHRLKVVVLCASGAIRIQWRNLRSIYHSWESQRHVYGSHSVQNSCHIWSKFYWLIWSLLLTYFLYLWCDLMDHFATEDIIYGKEFVQIMFPSLVHIWMVSAVIEVA